MPPTARIKPIQTSAYGRLFRSRLEARWAVFFTSLGLVWEYEPEGFDLDGELYLPDFRVWDPQGDPIWYEVKPAHVAEDGKFKRFATALPGRSGLLNGDPRHFLANHDFCPRCSYCLDLTYRDIDARNNTVSYLCETCDIDTPCGSGNPEQSDGVAGICYEPYKGWIQLNGQHALRWLKIVNASATNALSARFEHGEAPR